MASPRPTQAGWFIERDVNNGLDSIFFSNRALVKPADLPSSGAPQEDASHYACPRTPPRSLHSWGTYSPPPQRPRPKDVSPAGGTSADRPSSCSLRQGYHAHTLPLPRKTLAVFKPCVYNLPQGYKTSTVDKPRILRATITSSLSASSQRSPDQTPQLSKDQDQDQPSERYQEQATQKPPSLQPVHTKTPAVLQPRDNTKQLTKTESNSTSNIIKRKVDMTSQNVFGQPRLQASLRGPLSPQQTHRSSLEDELRRLIILDTPDPSDGHLERDKSCGQSSGSLSIETSLGSGPLDCSLTCSPVSDCPELGHLSASDLSLTADWERGLLPQPDPAWGLEWSNLVNVAKACEARRNQGPHDKPSAHGSLDTAALCPPYTSHLYTDQHTQESEVSGDLSDRLHHLEALLRHLESNLEKERQDKMALLEEVTILRETNQRLWEESLTANEQLRKLTLLFNVAPGMLPRADRE